MHLTTHQQACLQAMGITLYEGNAERNVELNNREVDARDALDKNAHRDLQDVQVDHNTQHFEQIEYAWLTHLQETLGERVSSVVFVDIASPSYDKASTQLSMPVSWSLTDEELKKRVWLAIQ
ncbi:MAG: hypothetical protein AAGJ37_06755 [Pseudomonadota bacterium]